MTIPATHQVDEPRAAIPTDSHLRVLHVVEAFGGGVYEIVRLLAGRHADLGHAVAIAYGIRPETPADVRAAVPEPVELHPMPWTRRSLGAQARTIPALRRLVREWQPDVVHLHSSFATILGAGVLPRTTPVVCSPHAYSFTMRSRGGVARGLFRALETAAARRVDVVGGVSESEAAVARSLGASNVRVVPNGIPELDDAPEGPLPHRVPSVIAIGRAEPQRQPEACARILGAVRDIASVGWVGGGSTSDDGVRALEAAGIPLTGWIPRDAAIERLGASRAYLHWTAWDGQPLSVLEAMARDVVVVASDIPANREILGEEQVCGTVDEAIELLRRVLTDDDVAHRLLRSQRQRRVTYSTTRMAADWLTVYREMADRS